MIKCSEKGISDALFSPGAFCTAIVMVSWSNWGHSVVLLLCVNAPLSLYFLAPD